MKNSTALLVSAALVAAILAPPVAGAILGGIYGGSLLSAVGGLGWGTLAGATPYALARLSTPDETAPKNKILRFFYEGARLYQTGLMGAVAVGKEAFTAILDKLFPARPDAQPTTTAPEAPSTFTTTPAAEAFAESATPAAPATVAPQNTVSGVEAKPGV